MKPTTLISFLISFLFLGCVNHTRIASVRNNVCKALEKKVVLYAVFVDSDGTHPWTEFDINSTLDSIQVAIDWLNAKGAKNGKNLNIELDFAKNEGRGNAVPFKEEFKYETLSGTLFRFPLLNRGIDLVDKWSNEVSKKVARNIPNDESDLVLSKNRGDNRERLIAKLRNKYQTDNIALIFFVNNYFENEISVAFHTSSSTKTEYAVVTNKTPAVIAHEFLHLFGAWDLYLSPFDRGFFAKMKKRKAMKAYPNEIMAFTHKRFDSLDVSPLTKYLIGWDDKLGEGEGKMFFGRRRKLLEY